MIRIKDARTGCPGVSLYAENHSLGEWFKRAKGDK